MVKKWILFLTAFLFSFLSSFAPESKPLSVVVIGGGLTGQAAAIEAHMAGAHVVVVEKRESYSRQSTLFLYTATLNLFDKWNVTLPHMTELEFKGERRGFVLIKDLEDSLAKRVHELGIQRLHGEFKDFADREQAAVIQTMNGDVSLPYDILVGADGAHSHVREKLGIPCIFFGEAIAGVAMVPAINPEKKIMVEMGKHADVFAKKVTIPFATILFIQKRPSASIDEIKQKELVKFSYEIGWLEEAGKIETSGMFNIENIPVYLKRAEVFTNSERAAILLGDAAGCGSLFQGTGANISLKTAELSGDFFRQFPEEEAYDCFNRNMEKVIDALMKDSMPLFDIPPSVEK